MENYVAIYLENKKIITHTTIKSLLEKLPAKQFIQTHKSYVVAIDKVDTIEGNTLACSKLPGAGEQISAGGSFGADCEVGLIYLNTEIMLIDLSHIIENGLVTYKGLPAPVICDYLSREDSKILRRRYNISDRQDRNGFKYRDLY